MDIQCLMCVTVRATASDCCSRCGERCRTHPVEYQQNTCVLRTAMIGRMSLVVLQTVFGVGGRTRTSTAATNVIGEHWIRFCFFFYPLWVRQRLLGQQIFTIHLSASVNLRIMLWYYCEWYDWMHTNKKYKQNRKHVWRKCVFTFNLMFYIPSMFLFGCTFCGAVAICPKAALISICCLSLLVSYFSICSVEYHSELLTNLIFHKDQSILISLNFSSAHTLLFSVWHHQMLFIFALRLSVCT